MGLEALKRLAPRQRQCLGMVASHISPKQIARDLEISENTVRGYLAESIKILEASDLRHAARMFSEGLPEDPQFSRGGIFFNNSDTYQHPIADPLPLREEICRVAERGPDEADMSSAVQGGPVGLTFQGKVEPSKRQTALFHFFRRGRTINDLSSIQRFIWIFLGAFFVTGLFAASMLFLEGIIVTYRMWVK